jgi:hypothetical protein
MPLFHVSFRLRLDVDKRLFLGQGKGRIDLFVEIPLVVLERQGIVSLLLDNLLGNLGLRVHRINRHDTSSKRSLLQQQRDRRDLVRLLLCCHLSQH